MKRSFFYVLFSALLFLMTFAVFSETASAEAAGSEVSVILDFDATGQSDALVVMVADSVPITQAAFSTHSIVDSIHAPPDKHLVRGYNTENALILNEGPVTTCASEAFNTELAELKHRSPETTHIDHKRYSMDC